MQSSEIRKRFLEYFENHGHKIMPSAPLVPSDPTVLLTLAGMLQFKPYFLGLEKPKHKRVTTCQKCVRMNDIEQVGKTSRHQTFFEMLGNFSFGDYFKRETILFAWEFLLQELKIDAAKLRVAVFEKDDETFEIWKNEIGISPFRLGEDNNFWAAGPSGPCGPCSEIYYDFGRESGCAKPDCGPGCECERFLEIWNLVFIEFNRNEKGELISLPKKNIDTGMGLERLARILQNVSSNFDTDLIKPIIDNLKNLSRLVSSKIEEENLSRVSSRDRGIKQTSVFSQRIVADHLRAAVFLIADGVLPSNEARGYVLRRLIRRAVRHGKVLGINELFLSKASNQVLDIFKEAYPGLSEKKEHIENVLKIEEENFRITLESGLEHLQELMDKFVHEKIVPGEEIFKLHDTYGFPVDLTEELLTEKGIKIDKATFEKEMQLQKERSRGVGINRKDIGVRIHQLDLSKIKPTHFVGYDHNEAEAKIVEIFPNLSLIALESSPCYPEGGGQIGDSGIIMYKDKEYIITHTYGVMGGVILHYLGSSGDLKEGDRVKVTIDIAKRVASAAHHTATHILHAVLRQIIGPEAVQSGSYVGADRLRFDFARQGAIADEDLEEIEILVNQKIKEKIKVEVLEKSFAEAQKMGALALFGEKYGKKVRIIKIDNFSIELCGGCHVKNTEEIGFFKIIKEEAIAAGVRRIEAVAGEAAKVCVIYEAKNRRDKVLELIKKAQLKEIEKEGLGGHMLESEIFEIETGELDNLRRAIERFDSPTVKKFLDHLKGRVEWLQERINKTEKEIEKLKVKNALKEIPALIAAIKEIKGIKVLTKELIGYPVTILRETADKIKEEIKSCILVLVTCSKDKVSFIISVSDDLTAKGYSAIKLAKILAEILGGSSGGRENLAQGGGKDATKIEEAFTKIINALS